MISIQWVRNVIIPITFVTGLHIYTIHLYFGTRAFFKTPNFVGWLNIRREEANQKLRLLHLDMLCKAVSFNMTS